MEHGRNPRSQRQAASLNTAATPPAGASRARRWRRRGLFAASVLLALAALLFVFDRLYPLPPIDSGGAAVVVAADGTPLRNYPSRDGIWRYPVKPDQVSPHYLDTLLTYEDRWFYWHPGVNPVSLARAGWQWATNRRIVSGGSTLTMQVARLIDPQLAGKPSRSMSAKLRQAWRAVQLEMHYSKDEILSLYLTHAPMGGIVEGVEMGSRLWLGKPARDLSPAESAMLTALPQAPSRLRPDRHPEAAQAARDKVLDRMVELGRWTPAEVADAKIEQVVAPPLRARWLAPLAAQRLLQEAGRPQAGTRRPGSRPPLLTSTLDADMQAAVERMLLDRVDNLPPKVSMAVLVMDNDTLEVKAYAGSADFSDDSRYAHVDMVRGVRSPGSTLKPFLYAQALDDGLIHSESLLIDAPLSFGGYAPGNFQASFSGPVSVAQALQRSLNVPAVDLLDRVGPSRFASVMLTGGVWLRMPAGAEPNLSLILGGGGTTLEELVGAYRALARGGDFRASAPAAGAAPGRVPYDECWRGLDCPRHPGGRRPPGSALLPVGQPGQATGLENRDEFRVPGRLGGGGDRQLDDRRVGGPAGRHAQPRVFRGECGGAATAGYRRGPAGRRPARARAARHGAAGRDLLAAGLPPGQRAVGRVSRAARGLGPE